LKTLAKHFGLAVGP